MNATRKHARAPQQEIALQVVPLIDVMFLLLLFFMLGADMSQRASSELELPVAAVPPPPARSERTLTANIHHAADVACAVHASGGECRAATHWQRSILGRALAPAELEAELARAARDEPEPGGAGRRSATHVLVRADAHAPYGEVQRLIAGAARAGLYKLELAATRKP